MDSNGSKLQTLNNYYNDKNSRKFDSSNNRYCRRKK